MSHLNQFANCMHEFWKQNIFAWRNLTSQGEIQHLYFTLRSERTHKDVRYMTVEPLFPPSMPQADITNQSEALFFDESRSRLRILLNSMFREATSNDFHLFLASWFAAAISKRCSYKRKACLYPGGYSKCAK